MIAPAPPSLHVGIVLVPDFTMLALSAFIDTLRLAADEGDRSRPIRCAWQVMSDAGHPVRASNGVVVQPASGLADFMRFDYLAVVGGTLHRGPRVSDATQSYLTAAAQHGLPLIGLCTASFVLARAGLMEGRSACVSWFHKEELEAEFPRLRVVADRLFVEDRDRITCAGGTSVIHLASHLIERHLGTGASAKGLRIMLEDHLRAGASPQPPPAVHGIDEVADSRVRRAMLAIERQMGQPFASGAIAREVGLGARQLNRLFKQSLGMSMQAYGRALRLSMAERRVREESVPFTEIAHASGYADASHFTRDFRRTFGTPPRAARRAARSGVRPGQ